MGCRARGDQNEREVGAIVKGEARTRTRLRARTRARARARARAKARAKARVISPIASKAIAAHAAGRRSLQSARSRGSTHANRVFEAAGVRCTWVGLRATGFGWVIVDGLLALGSELGLGAREHSRTAARARRRRERCTGARAPSSKARARRDGVGDAGRYRRTSRGATRRGWAASQGVQARRCRATRSSQTRHARGLRLGLAWTL